MAQPLGGSLISSAAELATYGATNRMQFCSRRPSAQPTAQRIGGSLILGGQARNLWRNQWEVVLFSAAERATYGATNKRLFCFFLGD